MVSKKMNLKTSFYPRKNTKDTNKSKTSTCLAIHPSGDSKTVLYQLEYLRAFVFFVDICFFYENVFSHPEVPDIVSVPAHRPIKPVYVRQFVALVDKIKESQA